MDAATSPILKVMNEEIPLPYQQWLKATRLPPYFQIFFSILYSCVKMLVCKVDSRQEKKSLPYFLPTVNINMIFFFCLSVFHVRDMLYRVFSKTVLTRTSCKYLIILHLY